VAIFADVNVKHAWHPQPLELAARDTARNLPDALIVTGSGTGQAAGPEDLATVKAAAGLPVLVGSGVTPENVAEYLAADGFIVGTAIKRDGDVHASVDPARVAALAARIAMLRAGGTGQGV
jgi:predicted TIM-barrel enzyme